MVAWDINRLLSWVSPEDEESTPSPVLQPSSPGTSSDPSTSPAQDLALSRSKTTDPSSVGLGRARALSRPQYMRSSTLRTIEEGESPYGSFLSRSSSFPPTTLPSPMLGPVGVGANGRVGSGNANGGSSSGSRSRMPSLNLLGKRRGSKDSHASITEEDESEGREDLDRSKRPQRSSSLQRTPEAGPGPTTLSRGNGPHSPSPSPGRIERRRKAALNPESRSGGEGSSRDSSPSKVPLGTARRGMLRQEGQVGEVVRSELGIRGESSKGKGRLMEVDSSDDDCPVNHPDRAAGTREHDKEPHRRLKVMVLDPEDDEGGMEDVEPIVLRSPGSRRSSRRKRSLSGERTAGGESVAGSTGTAVKSPRSHRSSAHPHPDQEYVPDLSLNADERTRLLGPPDLEVPSVRSPNQTEPNGKSSGDTEFETGSDVVQELVEQDSETPEGVWYRGPLFEAGWKLGLMFVLFTGVIVGVGWFALPAMDPADKAALRLPRSFQDLQTLNTLFQKYKTNYPIRILTVGCAAYLYVQMFSLPGSMYISILFGAAYGVFYGLILSCLCEAFGALLCYALSAVVGPPLLTIPSYRQRLEAWRSKIMGDPSKGEAVTWDGVFAFLIVLRISPFPPHWVANVVAPHLDISPLLFWCACFIGIGPVSVIHVTIGSGLDKMTSAEDFHILSLRNVLGLIGIGVAVMIPTALKRIFKKDLSGLGENEAVLHKPHIHVHDVSRDSEAGSQEDDRAETSTLGSNASSGYDPERDAGLGLISPNVLNREGYYWSSAKKGRGKGGEYMDLDEALSIIQQEEEHEILAVAYPGDTAESVLGLYQREAAAAENDQVETGSEDEGRQGGGLLAGLGQSLSRRSGYGTIEGSDVETGLAEDGSDRGRRSRKWWQVWR